MVQQNIEEMSVIEPGSGSVPSQSNESDFFEETPRSQGESDTLKWIEEHDREPGLNIGCYRQLVSE